MKWYRISALLLKYWYMTINSIDRVFDVAYWPILDIFIWGFMTIFINQVSSLNLMSVVFGGFILWVFLWRATQDVAVFTLEDFWFKSLYHMYSSPVRTSEIMLSIIIMALCRAIFSFTFMSLLAFLFYKVNVYIIGMLYLPIFAFLLLIMGYGLGMMIAGIIYRMGTKVQVIGWSIVWILQPFSCVFYPLSAVPSWAYPIAHANPITHIFESMRAVINGTPVEWTAIAYGAFGAVVIFIAGAVFMYQSIKKARETGLLVRGGY